MNAKHEPSSPARPSAGRVATMEARAWASGVKKDWESLQTRQDAGNDLEACRRRLDAGVAKGTDPSDTPRRDFEEADPRRRQPALQEAATSPRRPRLKDQRWVGSDQPLFCPILSGNSTTRALRRSLPQKSVNSAATSNPEPGISQYHVPPTMPNSGREINGPNISPTL